VYEHSITSPAHYHNYCYDFWVFMNPQNRTGRPSQTSLRTVETDLRPMNLGLASAERCAQDRAARRQLMTTATSTTNPWRREQTGIETGVCYICRC